MRYTITSEDNKTNITLSSDDIITNVVYLKENSINLGTIDKQKDFSKGFVSGVLSSVCLIVLGLILSDLIK